MEAVGKWAEKLLAAFLSKPSIPKSPLQSGTNMTQAHNSHSPITHPRLYSSSCTRCHEYHMQAKPHVQSPCHFPGTGHLAWNPPKGCQYIQLQHHNIYLINAWPELQQGWQTPLFHPGERLSAIKNISVCKIPLNKSCSTSGTLSTSLLWMLPSYLDKKL